MENPFSHLADEKLMELYKNGENMAFEVIYARHKDRVYSYLNKRLVNKSKIDDIFQSIFLKFHNSRLLYNSEHSLTKWLYVICKSELLDFAKKKKLKIVELNQEHLIHAPQESSSTFSIDDDKSLSDKEKEALKLRYFSDDDFANISKKLNTTESNARKLVSRGLQKLRAKYLGVKNDCP